MWFYIVFFLAKLGGALIRFIFPQKGTDFPGRFAIKLNKSFPKGFKNIDFDKVILITGSNGKSTTTNLLYHTLSVNGYSVASNLKGSNMLNGATTVFIRYSKLNARPAADYYIIEVDERSFPEVYENFPAKHVVITNIMQDQVHRNGEPDLVYQLLKGCMNEKMTLYLNNDEPRSKSYEDNSPERIYFGVDRNSASYQKDGSFDVTMPCPKCHNKINFDYMNVANTGSFHCESCGFASESENFTKAENINFEQRTFTVGGDEYSMPYEAPVMLYNYSAVIAAAKAFGLPAGAIASAFKTFVNVSGRMETFNYKGKTLKYIRMKQENPETLQGALDAIAQDKSKKVFIIGLCTLDERRPQWAPHYANTYYAYECNFKPLLALNTEKIICFSEYVCYDIANRLYYDGAQKDDVIIINSDRPEEVLKAVESLQADNVYIITLMRVMEAFKAYIKNGN